METSSHWPVDGISSAEFETALQAVNSWQRVESKDDRSTLDTFIEALATPELRLKISTVTEYKYTQLTDWVICADLMRIAGIDAHQAQTLRQVGVVGAQDLGIWSDDSHIKILAHV